MLGLLTRNVGMIAAATSRGRSRPGDQFGVPEMMKPAGAESLGVTRFDFHRIMIVGA